MIRWLGVAGIAVALVGGCGSPASDAGVASKSGDLAATKVFNADFHFSSPEDCVVHVIRVTRDTNANVIEFDATGEKTGRPISATYLVTANDSHPLHLIMSAGAPGTGTTLFSVLLSATDENVLDPRNDTLFDERGFFADTPTAPASTAGSDDVLADALGIAQCSLEMQASFGILPALQNKRATVVDPSGNVTTNDPEGPTLVTGWPNGEPFGEALYRAVECLRSSAGSLAWACGR